MVEVSLVKSLPLFRSLGPRGARALAAAASERRFAAGRTLFLAGERPAGLLVVISGRVRVVCERNGRQHLVHEEGPGGALGEVPLFAGGGYAATAIAAQPTRCLLLSTRALRVAMEEDSALAFLLLKRLAERTRRLVERVDQLAGQSVEGRLARFLLEQHRTVGAGVPFRLGRNQEEAAQAIGTVREVLVRTLRRFRESGSILAVGGGRYRVLDETRLAALAS